MVAQVNVEIRYPDARWAVMDALASLSDREHQDRVWIRRELPHKDYLDGFDQVVHTLYDDWVVLPEPKAAVGSILVDGPEVPRLASLGVTLDRLIAELGDVADTDYLRHADWPQVVTQAGLALASMVLAGPIVRPL
jgi:hypothetical protein